MLNIEKVKSKLELVTKTLNNPTENDVKEYKYLYENDSRVLAWYYNISGGTLDVTVESSNPSGCGRSFNTKSIIVEEYSAVNGKYNLHFTLIDLNDVKIFIQVIMDLIIVSDLSSTAKEGVSKILERFAMWKSMLKHRNEASGTAKGVVGEMIVFKHLLEVGKDPMQVVNSWVGPESSQQDFIFDNMWVEVKSISSHASTVSINSLGQLDLPDRDGYLFVVTLDEIKNEEPDKINVAILAEEIRNILKVDNSALLKFEEKMKEFEYHRFLLPTAMSYHLKQEKLYEVRGEFPRLFNSYHMNGIKTVHYDLLISMIDNWSIDEGVNVWH